MFFKAKKLRQQKSGFSLVEVMVAVAALGIISYYSASMLRSTGSVQRGLKLTDNLQNTAFVIKSMLADSNVCRYNLANLSALTFDKTLLNGATPPVFSLAQITSQSTPAQVLVSSGQALTGAPGTIVKLSVGDIKEVTPDFQYLGEIIIDLNKDPTSSGNVIGAVQIQRKIPIVFTTSASGNIMTITSCTTATAGGGGGGPPSAGNCGPPNCYPVQTVGVWILDNTATLTSQPANLPACPSPVMNSAAAYSMVQPGGFCEPITTAQCWVSYSVDAATIHWDTYHCGVNNAATVPTPP